jgi:hypothetical protein
MSNLKTTEWMAICPRCAMNVSQDYYPCTNCGYRPLTFEFTEFGGGGGAFGTGNYSSYRRVLCGNCGFLNSGFKCPNPNCGTYLDEVIATKKFSTSRSAAYGRYLRSVMLGFLIVFVFLIVVFLL